MVLVDTSIWIDHFRTSDAELQSLLSREVVLCHPFIIGELACGSLANRLEVLTLMGSLPTAVEADHSEVMQLIETAKLMSRDIGWVDAHLLASTRLSQAKLWTRDKRLLEISQELGCSVHRH